MYFWKTDLLIEDLKQDKVTQKEQMKYIIVLAIPYIFLLNPLFLASSSEGNFFDLGLLFIQIASLIVGTFLCYKANAKADDKDFLLRYTTLSLSICTKLVLWTIPLYIAGAIIASIFDPNHNMNAIETETTLQGPIFYIIFNVAYYTYSIAKFKRFSIDKQEG